MVTRASAFRTRFIRQALINGLDHFQFQLSLVGWLGSGFAIESLQDVISAYIVLENSLNNSQRGGVDSAILMKVAAVVKSIFHKVGIAEEAVSKADFMLRAYGATMLLLDGRKGITGLITHLAN